ncbi:MAG: protein-disulfide reductase DsbD family protein [Acidobacteriota bacterium]
MLSRTFRNGYRALIGWLVLFQPVGFAHAPANTPHATVALVSEGASIQPGHQFRVGLHFQLEKDWHIYWVNPGDSGEPPRVEWKLPAQFKVGPLQWPAPRRLENPPLTDYGYEDEVLLMATVRPPANLKPGGTAKLEANVKWLVCHDICIPGRQTVTLSLPVASDAPKYDPRWRQLFTRTSTRLPMRLPAGWSVTAAANPQSFVLSIKTGTREAGATFFPLESLQIKNAAPQQAEPVDGGVRLTLQKSDELLHPIASLKGILVLRHDKAYAINAPVTSQNSMRKSSGGRRPRK